MTHQHCRWLKEDFLSRSTATCPLGKETAYFMMPTRFVGREELRVLLERHFKAFQGCDDLIEIWPLPRITSPALVNEMV